MFTWAINTHISKMAELLLMIEDKKATHYILYSLLSKNKSVINMSQEMTASVPRVHHHNNHIFALLHRQKSKCDISIWTDLNAHCPWSRIRGHTFILWQFRFSTTRGYRGTRTLHRLRAKCQRSTCSSVDKWLMTDAWNRKLIKIQTKSKPAQLFKKFS